MAKLTWDDLIKDYEAQGYRVYDYRPMNAGKPASTWGDATIGVHGSGNSANAAPTNPALNSYHLTSGMWKGNPWVRVNRDPWQVGAGVYSANPMAGPQIAYAGPVGGKPGERTQAALDSALAYLKKNAPEKLKYIKGHGELYAADKRYSKHGRTMEEGSWAKGWEARVNPTRTITSAEAQYPAPPLPGQRNLTTNEMFTEILKNGELASASDKNPMNIAPTTPDTSVPIPQMNPPGASTSVPIPQMAPTKKQMWGDVATAPDEGAYGAVLNETTKPLPPSPVVDPNAGAKGTTVPKEVLAEVLQSKDLAQPGPPERQYGPKQRGWANEDLSAPPAPAQTPPPPVTAGPTPQRLRPDQTSNWTEWAHGQMQGALNTGPKYYVPDPNKPKPVTPFNMNLSNLLGGFKIF